MTTLTDRERRKEELRRLSPRQLVTIIKRYMPQANVSESSSKPALVNMILGMEYGAQQ
jgi:hypothetical protein